MIRAKGLSCFSSYHMKQNIFNIKYNKILSIIALKKRKTYEWKFPKFGKSPMSTPESTSRPGSVGSAKKEEKKVENVSKRIIFYTEKLFNNFFTGD